MVDNELTIWIKIDSDQELTVIIADLLFLIKPDRELLRFAKTFLTLFRAARCDSLFNLKQPKAKKADDIKRNKNITLKTLTFMTLLVHNKKNRTFCFKTLNLIGINLQFYRDFCLPKVRRHIGILNLGNP